MISAATATASRWPPGWPCCPPRLRPDGRRKLFGGGFESPSDDGGRDEFREFSAKRRFSSLTSASSTITRPRNSSITAACSTTNPASCSNERPPDDTQHRSPPSQRSLPHLNSHSEALKEAVAATRSNGTFLQAQYQRLRP